MKKRMLAILLVGLLAAVLLVPAGASNVEPWEGRSITLNNGRRVFELFNEDAFWGGGDVWLPRMIAVEYSTAGGFAQEVLLWGNAEYGEIFGLGQPIGSRFFTYVSATQETGNWSGLLFYDSVLRRTIAPPQMVRWSNGVHHADGIVVDADGRGWVEPVPDLGDESCGTLYYFYISDLYTGSITLRTLDDDQLPPSQGWVQLLIQILQAVIDWLRGLGN